MFSWFVVNLLLAVVIVSLQYFYPKLVLDLYFSRADLFFDNLTGYIVNIILLFIGVSYIRKSYEKEKKSANEKALILEKQDSEKNKLFSIVSHDLKTPLASVQQYLVLLNQMELDAKERKWIEANLLKTTTNTLELLTNLLHWCKTQMDGGDVNLKPLNLNDILKKVLEIINAVAKSKSIIINTSIENDVFIVADVDMLQLIIRNLLLNAIKFTKNNGIIDIVALKSVNNCIISIADNGVGMDAEAQKEAFSLKIKSTYGTQNETGTGLGLVLCKEYTEIQNGKIWFSSQINVGTVFNLQFPLYKNYLSS